MNINDIQKFYTIHEEGIIENKKTGRFIKSQSNGKGYLKVTLTINGKQYQKYVHRLVAEVFSDRKEWQNQVNHIDGNKSNNEAQNLEWVSNSENQIHAHKNGLKRNGNELWNGLFSKKDVEKIKRYDEDGMKRKDIAILMNCSKSTISDILNGKRYKYI